MYGGLLACLGLILSTLVLWVFIGMPIMLMILVVIGVSIVFSSYKRMCVISPFSFFCVLLFILLSVERLGGNEGEKEDGTVEMGGSGYACSSRL